MPKRWWLVIIRLHPSFVASQPSAQAFRTFSSGSFETMTEEGPLLFSPIESSFNAVILYHGLAARNLLGVIAREFEASRHAPIGLYCCCSAGDCAAYRSKALLRLRTWSWRTSARMGRLLTQLRTVVPAGVMVVLKRSQRENMAHPQSAAVLEEATVQFEALRAVLAEQVR